MLGSEHSLQIANIHMAALNVMLFDWSNVCILESRVSEICVYKL